MPGRLLQEAARRYATFAVRILHLPTALCCQILEVRISFWILEARSVFFFVPEVREARSSR